MVGAVSTAVHEIVNPATEEIVTTVELTSLEQTDAAIERAAAAFPAWRAVAPGDRGRLLRRFAEAVDGDLEHLAALEVANAGHTIGNAYLEADRPRVPATLREAAALWTDSALARAAFGDDVVDHYANNARVELAAYDAAVTDWERRRGFERL